MNKTDLAKKLEIIEDNFEYARDRFNFHKVKMAMQAVDWTWASSGKVPSIPQMEDEVYRLFEHAFNDIESGKEKGYCSSGGFVVEISNDNHVMIQFIMEDQGSEENEQL
jgi:hypothetical protein